MEIDFTKALFQRDDIFFKLPLARSLLAGTSSNFAEALYLEHLFHWGGFSEDSPKKRGANDFLQAFSELVSSIRENGFSREHTPPGINTDGQLVGGSHRVAAAIALSQVKNQAVDFQLRLVEYPTVDFSFRGFRGLGVHDSAIREASIEKINFFREPHVPLLVIWPRASEYRERILQILSRKWPHLDRLLDVSLSSRGLSNFIALAYRDEEWCSNASDLRGKLIDVVGKNGVDNVTIVLLEPAPAAELLELKTEIRELWGGSFQGVHTTDSWEESLRIFSTLSSPESTAALELTEVKKYMAKQNEFASHFSNLDSHRIGPIGYGVSGSQWLDYFGVRKSNDIDLISHNFFGAGKKIETHNSYLSEFGFSAETILSEPVMHTWVMGRKHIAPWVYARIMEQRAEDKDLVSRQAYLRKIDQIDGSVRDQLRTEEDILNKKAGAIVRNEVSPFSSYLLASGARSNQRSLSSIEGERQQSGLLLALHRLRWRLSAVIRRLPLLLPLGLRTRVGRSVRGVVRRLREKLK